MTTLTLHEIEAIAEDLGLHLAAERCGLPITVW